MGDDLVAPGTARHAPGDPSRRVPRGVVIFWIVIFLAVVAAMAFIVLTPVSNCTWRARGRRAAAILRESAPHDDLALAFSYCACGSWRTAAAATRGS